MRKWWERANYTFQEAVLLQKVLLILERQYLVPHSSPVDGPVAQKMNRKRFAAKMRRAALKTLHKPLPRNLPKQLLIARRSESPALEALCPTRTTRWVPVLSRTKSITIDLSGFSFLDNPRDTIEAFRAISEAETDGLEVRLNFKDTNCLDVGAMLVLEEIWPRLCPVFTGGDIEPMVGQMLEAVGLRKIMGWKPMSAAQRNRNIYPLPFRRQDRAGSTTSIGVEPQRSQIVATQVVRFIDTSLRQASGVSLTKNARITFHSLIGEILDNAGAHASPDQKGGYSICGFLERREQAGEEYFRFNIGFLSMGQTIADGLEKAPPQIFPAMSDYISKHQGVNGLTEENLRTVYAIRDGVTRLPEKLKVVQNRSLGGTGLADILDFFDRLALFADPKDTPRLAIISGNTYIQASGAYRKATRFVPAGLKEANSAVPRELWFNEMNVKSEPPDAKHVYALPSRLQGTLVTLAFNLDPYLIEKLKDASNGSNNG